MLPDVDLSILCIGFWHSDNARWVNGWHGQVPFNSLYWIQHEYTYIIISDGITAFNSLYWIHDMLLSVLDEIPFHLSILCIGFQEHELTKQKRRDAFNSLYWIPRSAGSVLSRCFEGSFNSLYWIQEIWRVLRKC